MTGRPSTLWSSWWHGCFGRRETTAARDMVLKILDDEGKAWASAGFTHLLKLFPKVASFRSQSHFNVIA